MYEYEIATESTMTGADSKRPGAMDDLDRELTQLDEAIDRLSAMLAPVTSQYGLEKAHASEPRPEPASALRGRIERVRQARERLHRLMGDLDL